MGWGSGINKDGRVTPATRMTKLGVAAMSDRHPLNVVRRWQTRNNKRVLAAIPHGRWGTAHAIARSAGVRNPSRIYPALDRLLAQGLIEARWVPQYAPADRRRCYYTRTEKAPA